MTKETSLQHSNIHTYLSQEFHFTDLEIARIRYAIISIFSETSKILIMFFLFYLSGMHVEFLISIIVLLSIRNFTGGIHLQHYLSCLAFTFTFLLCAILLSRYCVLPLWMEIMMIGGGMPVVYKIGTVSSDKRPAPSPQRSFVFKVTACLILTAYVILFLCVKNLPWIHLIFWVIVLQIAQLTVAKMIKERSNRHEKNL